MLPDHALGESPRITRQQVPFRKRVPPAIMEYLVMGVAGILFPPVACDDAASSLCSHRGGSRAVPRSRL